MVRKVFGKTGIELSTLGFGAMRLPTVIKGDQTYIDDDLAIPMMLKSFELGVNYIDTAPYYVEKLSEAAVGRALKAWKAQNKSEKIYVSTKYPTETEDFMGSLEKSLKQLDIDCVDFYHMWGIGGKSFREKVMPKGGPMDQALKAKEQGMIGHISFSYHDDPSNMKEIIDSGYFESVLLQYNLLDRSNAQNIDHAHAKGLGVVVMGPVAGGRLSAPSPVIEEAFGKIDQKPVGTPEVAMRYVLANPNVHMALSGMETMQMVTENAAICAREWQFTPELQKSVADMLEETKRLSDLYCTGCNYCMPCAAELNIPRIFQYMNYHKIYGLTNWAKQQFAQIGNEPFGPKYKPVSSCTECGLCEEKCPQKLEIIKQLKETAKELA